MVLSRFLVIRRQDVHMDQILILLLFFIGQQTFQSFGGQPWFACSVNVRVKLRVFNGICPSD